MGRLECVGAPARGGSCRTLRDGARGGGGRAWWAGREPSASSSSRRAAPSRRAPQNPSQIPGRRMVLRAGPSRHGPIVRPCSGLGPCLRLRAGTARVTRTCVASHGGPDASGARRLPKAPIWWVGVGSRSTAAVGTALRAGASDCRGAR